MRGVQIFSGTSHPTLTDSICERLGAVPAPAELRKFSNGETLVNIGISVRNQDVYIVQSGSSKINDSLMELLIMISACKGGSAKTITGMTLKSMHSQNT
jgi:ribose-phosphate pyrophosphokinase